MIELISKGGAIMWLLFCCSVVSLGFYLERYAHYFRSSIFVSEFMEGIASLVRSGNYLEAANECAASPNPVSRVVQSALLRHTASREQLKAIVTESGQLEVPRLERYLRVLMALGYLAPLLGLLGTVVGLAETFNAINTASGVATAGDIGVGVQRSLFDAAGGLVVAIEVFLFHNHLLGKLHDLMHDMERAGIEIVNLIDDERSNRQIIHLPLQDRFGKTKIPGEPDNVLSGSFSIVG